ncbi:MAG TPA: hypothetical protein VIA06_06320 [Candidatus Dormibacteraeota bacterium]|jgi:hypothetical protein|nr:hypothetical protein [Candidatus Dormibacteraeota bacterium]
MYDERVLWDAWNRKAFQAFGAARGITPGSAEEVLGDPFGDVAYAAEWNGWRTIGRTATGRWLIVMWIRRRAGRYPLYARDATDMVRRLLEDGEE